MKSIHVSKLQESDAFFCRSLALMAAFCIMAASSFGQDVLPSASDRAQADRELNYFENSIRPLLIAQCIQCHGADKQEGNLRLDSEEGMLAGGDNGPAIVRGSSKKSLLVAAVRHEDLEMPPNKKLTDEQIEALAQWIDSGAKWPTASHAGLTLRQDAPITDADRDYWAFRPLKRVAVPNASKSLDADRVRNPIDAFVIEKQTETGISLAPEADRIPLLRRIYFDLVGVPPTPDEAKLFLEDARPDAYEHLVDRLLDDSRYGKHWTRHWLDLVRYAESDGFKSDAYRPTAYLYRDYVIKAFNEDRPYDRFVAEQLAGDEIAPSDPDAMAATGFLRHWIYEYNQRDVRSQWSNILNDLTDVTGEVFLGLGVACARCHDHKFDPILQRDYYRLQASFAAFLPRDSTLAGKPEEIRTYQAKLAKWNEATASIREQMAQIERASRQRTADKAIDKFPPDIRPMLRKQDEVREPFDKQIADLAYRQITNELTNLDFKKVLKGEEKEQWEKLSAELAAFDSIKPKALPAMLAAADVGSTAPPTFIPPVKKDSVPVEPATFEVLGAQPITPIPPKEGQSTGRRAALAEWINRPDNPLSHRVIVNRVWQYHFGNGLVGNSSDFGRLGSPPTHPELLDWLANWWLENGRSFKKLHRLIVTSATYRQSSRHPQSSDFSLADLENKYLWHYPARRLDAEQVRDAMLVATGTLENSSGGPSADHASRKRTVYTKVLRNTPNPLLNVLDAPDGTSSIAKRNVTTTPIQSLLLSNSTWPIQLAQEMAKDLQAKHPSTEDQVKAAFLRTLTRVPSQRELAAAIAFLDDQASRPSPANQSTSEPSGSGSTKNSAVPPTSEEVSVPNSYALALGDFCHVLLNCSEFLYID